MFSDQKTTQQYVRWLGTATATAALFVCGTASAQVSPYVSPGPDNTASLRLPKRFWRLRLPAPPRLRVAGAPPAPIREPDLKLRRRPADSVL